MRFAGRRVVVTGASRGIGRAVAAAFQREGAFVIGTHTGGRMIGDEVCDEWVRADFGSASDIETCADHLCGANIDVLVNNAGINKIASFTEIAPADFLAIQQINVFAPFRLCQAVLPSMRAKGWGRIVNVSSIFGKISKTQRASYSASKFALDGLTVALAAEFAAHGVLANAVAPGFIDTDLTRRVLGDIGMSRLAGAVPAQRLGRAEEVARLVLFLASEENTYITGQNIAIDGGFSRV